MRLFSKPKPILTLSKGFYMTVFSTSSVLPPLIDLIHPRRMNHVVVGMGAPMVGYADPETLAEPMKPGPFALVTMNRKTVLRTLIMSIDECTIDLNAIAAEQATLGIDEETMARLRGAWFVTQFSFESFDPQIFASIRFLYRLADRLAELTDGVIADPLAQRYIRPGQLFRDTFDEEPLQPLEVVSVGELPGETGPRLRTFGMGKFDQPDFAIELPHADHIQHGHTLLTAGIRTLFHGRPAHHAFGNHFVGELVADEPEVMLIRHKPSLVDFPTAFASWHQAYTERES